MVYATVELDAMKRFESVSVGDTEEAVREKLGDPACLLIVKQEDEPRFAASCPESGAMVDLPSSRRHWPPTLYAFKLEATTSRVLAYSQATVVAYYSFSELGRVVFRRVYAS